MLEGVVAVLYQSRSDLVTRHRLDGHASEELQPSADVGLAVDDPLSGEPSECLDSRNHHLLEVHG